MLTLGRITDRVGRRPALVAGMAITAVSSIAFAAARNVGWLFAGEIIYGIAAGLVMSATTVTIRELHPKQHAGGALWPPGRRRRRSALDPLSGVLATVTRRRPSRRSCSTSSSPSRWHRPPAHPPDGHPRSRAIRFSPRFFTYPHQSGAPGRPRRWRPRPGGCSWVGSSGCHRRSCTNNSGSRSPSRSSPASSPAPSCSPTASPRSSSGATHEKGGRAATRHRAHPRRARGLRPVTPHRWARPRSSAA